MLKCTFRLIFVFIVCAIEMHVCAQLCEQKNINALSKPCSSGHQCFDDSGGQTPKSPSPESGFRIVANENEGFRIESTDDRFVFQPGLISSLRVIGAFSDHQQSAKFDNRLLRFSLRGHLFRPWFTYGMQVEFAGKKGPSLLDAEIGVQIFSQVKIRAGQFRTPFSRAFVTPIVNLQLPGRSIISDYFRAGRDLGVQIEGAPFDGVVEYGFGIFNGHRLNFSEGHKLGDFLFVGRLAYAPFGNVAYDESPQLRQRYDHPVLSLGVSGYHKNIKSSATMIDPDINQSDVDHESNAIEFDATFFAGPFSLLGEWFFAWDQFSGRGWTRKTGGYVQAGQFLFQQKVDVVMRFNYLRPDHHLPEIDLWSIEVGSNAYIIADHFKLQLSYEYDRVDKANDQLPIVKTGHQVILQAQAYY